MRKQIRETILGMILGAIMLMGFATLKCIFSIMLIY